MICAEHNDEILEIANAIAAICAGRNSACVYTALSMVIGGAAATVPLPDFEVCLDLVKRCAFAEFKARRSHLVS